MSVTIAAPAGAHFEEDEVKTNRGQQSLGTVPILVWDDVQGARDHYTDEGIAAVLDGTSLRVAFQAIARRMKLQTKTDDEIAAVQIAYRPGKRAVGASTPVSRARKAADTAAEKLGAEGADLLTTILGKIAAGTITAEELAILNQ